MAAKKKNPRVRTKRRSEVAPEAPRVLRVKGRPAFVVISAEEYARLESDAEYARNLKTLRARLENPGRLVPWDEARDQIRGMAQRAARRQRKSA